MNWFANLNLQLIQENDMKDHVARAMMIAMMKESQIKNIQALESHKGYPLANHNIQTLCHLPAIRESCMIPEDEYSQAIHAQRIEKEIDSKHWVQMADPNAKGLDWIHSFDMIVFDHKNEIVWDYCGGKKGKKMMEEIKEG